MTRIDRAALAQLPVPGTALVSAFDYAWARLERRLDGPTDDEFYWEDAGESHSRPDTPPSTLRVNALTETSSWGSREWREPREVRPGITRPRTLREVRDVGAALLRKPTPPTYMSTTNSPDQAAVLAEPSTEAVRVGSPHSLQSRAGPCGILPAHGQSPVGPAAARHQACARPLWQR